MPREYTCTETQQHAERARAGKHIQVVNLRESERERERERKREKERERD